MPSRRASRPLAAGFVLGVQRGGALGQGTDHALAESGSVGAAEFAEEDLLDEFVAEGEEEGGLRRAAQ